MSTKRFKKVLLSFSLVFSMLVAMVPAATSANAKVGLTENELKDAFEALVMDAHWYSQAGTFSANEQVPDAIAMFYLHTTGQLRPYEVPDTWYYDLSYDELMKLMDENFMNHSDMRSYLIEVGALDEETNLIHFFMGGMGGPTAFVPTYVYQDANSYRVQGVVVEAYDLDTDLSDLVLYDDYLNVEYSEETGRFEVLDPNQEGRTMKICYFREMIVTSEGKIESLNPIDYLILNGSRYCYELDANNNSVGLKSVYSKYDTEISDKTGIVYEVEPNLVQFNDLDGNYILAGTKVQFKVYTSDIRYETGKVSFTDGSGETELIPDENGVYTFTTSRTPGTLKVETRESYTIKDGVLTFNDPTLGELYELKVSSDENVTSVGFQGVPFEVPGYYFTYFDGSAEVYVTVADGYRIESIGFTDETAGTVELADIDMNHVLRYVVKLNKPATLVIKTTNEVVLGTENDVTVSVPVGEEGKYTDVDLVVTPLEETNEDVVLVMEELGEDCDVVAYDIHLENQNGVEVQPDGTVKVTMPIPEGWDETRTFVYHVVDGKLVDMHGVVSEDGQTISFTTNHFSTYVLVQEPETTEEPDVPTEIPEDKPTHPQTGDNTNVALWTSVMTTSVVALAFVLAYDKKEKSINN